MDCIPGNDQRESIGLEGKCTRIPKLPGDVFEVLRHLQFLSVVKHGRSDIDSYYVLCYLAKCAYQDTRTTCHIQNRICRLHCGKLYREPKGRLR